VGCTTSSEVWGNCILNCDLFSFEIVHVCISCIVSPCRSVVRSILIERVAESRVYSNGISLICILLSETDFFWACLKYVFFLFYKNMFFISCLRSILAMYVLILPFPFPSNFEPSHTVLIKTSLFEVFFLGVLVGGCSSSISGMQGCV
jgi:hypothetical protein